MAGHTVRWQGAGSDGGYPEPEKQKTPIIFLFLAGQKINRGLLKLHRSCCSMRGVYVHAQKTAIPSVLPAPSVQHKRRKV